MALEIRYVPMMDEADNMPKIFRVVYDESGKYVTSSVSDYKEATLVAPQVVEQYFDLLSTYFKDFSTYIDSQVSFNRDIYFKMDDLRAFINYFFNNYDFDILNDE
jgi:hypothetical protein